MNCKFWQKEEPAKPEPRRLKIPAEKVRRLRRLSDTYEALPVKQASEAKYLLWEAIAEIFPEVREGAWSMESPTALDIVIVERFKA